MRQVKTFQESLQISWVRGEICESARSSARGTADGLCSLRQFLESLLGQGVLILVWVKKLGQPPKVLYRLILHHGLHSRCQRFQRCMNELVDDKDLLCILTVIIIAAFILLNVV